MLAPTVGPPKTSKLKGRILKCKYRGEREAKPRGHDNLLRLIYLAYCHGTQGVSPHAHTR